MFYNSKKLIDEKVLQQYFFEKFMLAKSNERKQLLPEKYQNYSPNDAVKGLNPEILLGEKLSEKNHIADFVLYPMPNKGLKNLNIELKWDISDFEKQKERYPYYNGEISEGFVVALKTNKSEPEFLDNNKIPVVYLDIENFKKWFTLKSYAIVSQALSTKLGIKPSRLSGEKYWLVTIVNKSFSHYINKSRKYYVWAFKDNKSPKNIIDILDGDYVVFLHFGHCKPARCLYPYYSDENKEFDTRRGGYIKSSEISWSIDLIDIRKVKKGFHLNYTDKIPYNVFDKEWIETENKTPETKEYTQFITFCKESDEFQYKWDRPKNTILKRELFNDKDEGLSDLIDASRKSMNDSGNAIEISKLSFESLLHLLQ